MGDEVGVSENNAVSEQVVPVKSSKKWIWISIVGVVVILLIVGGMSIWIDFKVSRSIELSDDSLYMYYKCLEYCPTKETYNEWGQGNTMDATPGSGMIKRINQECLNVCFDQNYKPLADRSSSLRDGIFESIFNKRRVNEYESYEPHKLPGTDCLREAVQGDNSCIDELTERIDRLEESFAEPIYENITFNFTSLSCSDEGVDVVLELIEGEVIGVGFLLSQSGNTADIKKMGSLDIGLNEIALSISEYPSHKGALVVDNPDKISMYYITEADEDHPNGRVSDIYSTLLCE